MSIRKTFEIIIIINFFFQDISGGFDWNLNIFGWQLDKDQLSIVITCAIAVIILSSVIIVFIIWYCCFCRKTIGKY